MVLKKQNIYMIRENKFTQNVRKFASGAQFAKIFGIIGVVSKIVWVTE